MRVSPNKGVIVDLTDRQAERGTGGLTPRQLSVLSMLSFGMSPKEAAAALKVSEKTIEWHRAKLMDGLQLYSFADMVRTAVAFGLVPL
jgi:DNA-binding NarL/FixJ family response regulator